MGVDDYRTWIVRVGGQYLVAVPYRDTKVCRMSNSPYDAAPIENAEDAEALAGVMRGVAVQFNPVTGVIS